jgi:hypothetical protein
MLKVKLYLFSLFLKFILVEVVRFLVSYGLARNKNRLCKGWDNRIVQKQKQKKPRANINKN